MQFCEWPVDYSACGANAAFDDLSTAGKARYEEMAGEYLWRWTGRRYGTCTATVRPCRLDTTAGLSTYGRTPGSGSPWSPVLVGGSWINVGCTSGHDTCGCTSGFGLRFEKPVLEIVSVEVDGAILPSGSYRLDDDVLLLRTDGGTWPYCQNMIRPLGEVDTWGVTLRYGTPVPAGGRIAAGKLAQEFAKAACGDKACELPQRWQTITRQGVTISAAQDLFQGLEEGKTGIYIIDAWVASVTKPDIGFSVASPDLRPVGRTNTVRSGF